VDPAIRYLTEIQVDPLNVIGHSQDLVLWGRIDGYRSSHLEQALYQRRSLFEWGGNLQIRPIEGLPHLRMVMGRVTSESRWLKFAKAHRARIAEVRRAIEQRGPLSGRDFEGRSVSVPGSFRGGKEATQVLYYLWLKGDLMIESRRGGVKSYDLTGRLVPSFTQESPVEEAEERILLRTLNDLGLPTTTEWLAYAHGRIRRSSLRYEWKSRVQAWRDRGIIQEVEVEGWPGSRWIPAQASSELEALRSGQIPRAWRPVSTTTEEEVTFLSPLEFATSRGRSQHLFEFELLCEFYKPAAKRRWGYYTLPILFGDDLVARIDMRLDPSSKSIRILGFWPEDPEVCNGGRFATALGRGLARLADFHSATGVGVSAVRLPRIERTVKRAFNDALTSPGSAS
jgi:uncharacterized protein